jgi:hypothetical protein
MTVNERLFVTGLMNDWDQAARAGDRKTMVSILSKVGLQTQAVDMVEAALAT